MKTKTKLKLKPSKATIQPIFRSITRGLAGTGKLEMNFETALDGEFWEEVYGCLGQDFTEADYQCVLKERLYLRRDRRENSLHFGNPHQDSSKIDLECNDVILHFQQTGERSDLQYTFEEGEQRLTITGGANLKTCIDYFAESLRQRHGNHFVVQVNAVDGSIIFSGRVADRTADLAAIEANKVWGYDDIAVYFNESVAYVKGLNYSRARDAARDNGLSPFPQPCSLSKRHPKWRRDDIIAWWEKNRGKK